MYWLYKNSRIYSNAYFIHVEEDKIDINGSVFPFDVIKVRSDFRPFGKFVFPAPYPQSPDNVVEDAKGGKHTKPYVMMPFEIYAQTAQSKVNQLELSFLNKSYYDVAMAFYPDTKNFKDALLMFNAPVDENTPFEVTTTDSKGNVIEYIPDRIITDNGPGHPSPAPVCDLQKVGFDGTATDLEFTYKDVRGRFTPCDFEAKVKTTCGFVSHTDLPVIGGKARFKWIPYGMPPGYQATIQVGIGKYSEVASITLDT